MADIVPCAGCPMCHGVDEQLKAIRSYRSYVPSMVPLSPAEVSKLDEFVQLNMVHQVRGLPDACMARVHAETEVDQA